MWMQDHVKVLFVIVATGVPWIYALRSKRLRTKCRRGVRVQQCGGSDALGVDVAALTSQLVQSTTCYKDIRKALRVAQGRELTRAEKRLVTDIIEAQKGRLLISAASSNSVSSNSTSFDSKNAIAADGTVDVPSLLTVLISTSPVSSNPRTEMLEEVLATFALVPRLNECRKIIVCDGFKVRDVPRHRAGCITADEVEKYQQYIANLRSLASGVYPASLSPSPPHELDQDEKNQQAYSVGLFQNTRVIDLNERQGFGFAVKAVLEMQDPSSARMAIDTPFLMVVQHDRTFMTQVPYLERLMKAMVAHEKIKYIGLPTSSQNAMQGTSKERRVSPKDGSIIHPYVHYIASKYKVNITPAILTRTDIPELNPQLPVPAAATSTTAANANETATATATATATTPVDDHHHHQRERAPRELALIPMVQWYDSTHICRVDHYRDFVFSKVVKRVAKGGFIEDKIGQMQLAEIKEQGMEAHAPHGTFFVDDGSGEVVVSHLNARDPLAHRKFKGKGKMMLPAA